MEKNGGCCTARYDGCGGVYDLSKVDRMMLRFRPIAPKPAISATAIDDVTPENSEFSVKTTRHRRMKSLAIVNKPTRKRKSSVKTLPFFPEAPEENLKRGVKQSFLTRLSFADCGHVTSLVSHVTPVSVVGSWVEVECVINTWVMNEWLGCTDEERLMSLDLDTCPGFVTDGLNNVIWMNGVYKKMVGGEGEVAAMVVVKEGVVLPLGCAAFTCKVRMVTCGKERGCKTVPCDVWRLDCGGFAWRLDTMTALCLGW